MAKLYRSIEIMNECGTAKKALDSASEWMKRTACGKMLLTKDEVAALLELCARLAMSVDLNLDAFDVAMKERDALKQSQQASSPKEPKEESRPAAFRLQDAAEEQAWESLSASRGASDGGFFPLGG